MNATERHYAVITVEVVSERSGADAGGDRAGDSTGDHAPDDRSGADLADRVRSALGPLVKALDLPRVHLMAEGHHVLIHGDVARPADAQLIEAAVLGIDGVDSIESHLHVGLLASDTRPSAGHPQPSAMYTQLLAAAARAGLHRDARRFAVAAAVRAILRAIPPGERAHVESHLPADVLALTTPRLVSGRPGPRPLTELGVEAATALEGGCSLATAERLVPKVVRLLRRQVPEEGADVAACLPDDLRRLWRGGRSRARSTPPAPV